MTDGRKKDESLEMALESIFTRTIEHIDDAVVRLGLDSEKHAELVRNAIDVWFGPDMVDRYDEWLEG